MASTYSNLKIQLMATGENNSTWGDVTNTNLGTAVEEAITGSADVAFSNANVTLTLADTNSSQAARNLRLNLTGTATAGYNLVVPSIEKVYIINNGTDGTVTVKNATGTGVAVPAGRTTWVFNDGANVVNVISYLASLTLGAPLPVSSGGTGSNATTFCNLTTNVVGVLPIANGGTGANTAADARTALGAGTVTSVGGTGSVNGLTLTGTVTGSGNLTLGGSVTSVNANATVNGVVIGYRNIPRSTTSGTATTGDIGKAIAVSANITIPNATFAAGDVFSVYNDSGSTITLLQGAGLTMRLAGTATTGNRTVAQRGMATIWFNSASECVVNGAS